MNVLLLGLALVTANAPRAVLETNDLNAIKAVATQVADNFNAADAATVATHWTLDGTCSNPIGEYAEGRANIQHMFQKDFETIFKGSHSTVSIQRILPLNADLAFVDVQHGISGMKRPDGTALPDQRIHVSVVVAREGNQWLVLHARPNEMTMPMSFE